MNFQRSMLIITPNGTEVTSNITNPMYFAPAASATLDAGSTNPSSVIRKNAPNAAYRPNKLIAFCCYGHTFKCFYMSFYVSLINGP